MSEYACTNISIDVVKALVMFAEISIISPIFALLLNSTSFIHAVTHIFSECVCAHTAAAISIHCTRRPPCNKPMGLVSLGQTTSVFIVSESDGTL